MNNKHQTVQSSKYIINFMKREKKFAAKNYSFDKIWTSLQHRGWISLIRIDFISLRENLEKILGKYFVFKKTKGFWRKYLKDIFKKIWINIDQKKKNN